MDREFYPFALLGIVFKNPSPKELARECIERIEKKKNENTQFYISSVNTELILRCHQWEVGRVKDIELLSTLRESNVAILSGFFLKRLARLLNIDQSPYFNPQEYFLSVCQLLGEKEKGIFILGHCEKEIKKAGIQLHDEFHKLRLVGIAAPPIFIEGENLLYTQERDSLLIEQINSSNADALIVNLGNIKEKIWFNRVRNQLFIPIVIALNYPLKGQIETEHILQQTKKWKFGQILKNFCSSAKTFSFTENIKKIWIAFPLVAYQSASRLHFKWFYSNKPENQTLKHNQLFLSANHSIAVITLPINLHLSNIPLLFQFLEETLNHDILILNFSHVCHIEPEGFYFLIKAWERQTKQLKEIYGFQPTPHIQRLMKLHRVFDLFKNSLCESAEILMSRIHHRDESFYYTFTQEENLVIISLLGALDKKIDYHNYMQHIIPILGKKNCVIDFSYCTFIDNMGFSFLLNINKYLTQQNRTLAFDHLSPVLKQEFQTVSLDKFFKIS